MSLYIPELCHFKWSEESCLNEYITNKNFIPYVQNSKMYYSDIL